MKATPTATKKKSKQPPARVTKTVKQSASLRTLIMTKKWDEAVLKIDAYPEEAMVEDRMGDLPLHIVCDSGAPFQVVQRLIQAHKPALQKRGFCGRLPLHYAAYSKPSVNVIKLLLRHYPEGATVLDEDGRLPLHLAVIRNAPKQSIEALIDAHPRALGTPNKFGNKPSELARNEHVAKLLEEQVHKPRNVKTKMNIVTKMNSVWNDPKINPMCNKSFGKGGTKSSNQTKNQYRHGQRQKAVMKNANDSNDRTPRANNNSKNRQALKDLTDPISVVNRLAKQKSEPSIPSSRGIMNGYSNDSIMSSRKKVIPSPTDSNRKLVMSAQRQNVDLPCPKTVATVQMENLAIEFDTILV